MLQTNSLKYSPKNPFTPKHRSAVQNSHPVFTSPARVLGFQDALACNPCKDVMSQFKIPFVSWKGPGTLPFMCVFTSDGLVGYTPQETQQSSPSLHIRKTTGDMGRRADEALFKPTKTNCTQNKKLQTKNDGFIPILARSSCTNFSLILGLARIQRVEKSCTQEPTYCSRRCLRQRLKIQPHNICCLQLMILNSLFFNPKSSPLLPTTVYVSHTQKPK
jgi:hypothetical protein